MNRAATAMAEEQSKGAEAAKRLAEATKEQMALQEQHHAEIERATMVLNKVQTTYQTQLMHYKSQEAPTARLIKQLKDKNKPQRISRRWG